MSRILGHVSVIVAAATLASCNIQIHKVRLDPASFSVHIMCAGTSATDCPGATATVLAGGICPAFEVGPSLGTPIAPVDRTQTYYVVQVQAMDNNGALYTPYNKSANVYIQFEGSVTPTRATGTPPLTTVPVVNGQGCFVLSLTTQSAFNQTEIWVEDPYTFGNDPSNPNNRIVTSGTFAVGSSEPIYRPAPQIADAVYTTDPVQELPFLNNKHVIVNTGTPTAAIPSGAPMVVTSVTPTFFTVTDLGTVANGYQWGSLEMYTYSEPYGVQVGSTVTQLNGQLSNYLGLPELNFPIWTVVNYNPDPVNAPQPAEQLINYSDITNTLGAMAPYRSGPVKIQTDANSTWTICAMREGSSLLASYKKYYEWVIAPPTADCTDWMESMEVVSNQAIPTFDPSQSQWWGKQICSMKGILSVVVPVANVNLWTITPRSAADLPMNCIVDSTATCPASCTQ